MADQTLRQRAIALYQPPFTFNRFGYITDANHQPVADNNVSDDESGKALLRVRGWGRISYMDDAAPLQDQVGLELMEALNAHWIKNGGVANLSVDSEGVERFGEENKYVHIRDYNELARKLSVAVMVEDACDLAIKVLQAKVAELKALVESHTGPVE